MINILSRHEPQGGAATLERAQIIFIHRSIPIGGESLRIRWFGHACFEVSEHESVITDPHDGKSIGIAVPVVRGDIVLISHDHFDHNCARIVKGTPTVVRDTGDKDFNGVKIRGIRTYHDDMQGAKRGENIIYRFEMSGFRFCHLGDVGHVVTDETAAAIAPIDIIFVPVGGVFTIDAEKAWAVCDKLKPKIIIPMHYRIGGLSLSIQPLAPFLAKAENIAVNKVGNEIEFEADDLPESAEIWAFTL